MEESDSLAVQIEQLEAEVLTIFGSNIVLLLAALQAILDFFGLTKVVLKFNNCLPSDVTKRPPEYQAITPANVTVYTNQSIGKLPKPSMPGYDFAGWYTTTGYKTEIKDYSKVTFTKTTTLYAKWVHGYVKVTLDPFEGSVYPAEISCIFDEPFGSLPEPTKPDNTFSYWKNSDGVAIYSYTTLSSYLPITLTAAYNEVSYKLIYDPNGGVGKVPPTTRHTNQDTRKIHLETDWRSLYNPGFDFAGWVEAKNTPYTEVVSEIEPLWMDTKVYACWKPHTYDLIYANTCRTPIKTKYHSTRNIKCGDVYELDDIEDLGIFNASEKENFDVWHFGSKTVRNNEYVMNLSKRQGDTVYLCHDETNSRRYSATVRLQDIAGNNYSTIYKVRDMSFPTGTSFSKMFFTDLQEVPMDPEGFEFYKFRVNNEETPRPASEAESFKNGSLNADTHIDEYFARRLFKIEYFIKSDQTGRQWTKISEQTHRFETDLNAISSTVYIDPYLRYGSYYHDSKIYKFTKWNNIPAKMPSQNLSSFAAATVIADHLNITYDLNDGSNRTKTIKEPFVGDVGTVTYKLSSLSQLGYTNTDRDIKGWAKTRTVTNDSQLSAPGTQIVGNSNEIYYSIWNGNTITITYKLGSETRTSTHIYNSQAIIGNINITPPQGQIISKWRVENGTTEFIPGSVYIAKNNLVLVAVTESIGNYSKIFSTNISVNRRNEEWINGYITLSAASSGNIYINWGDGVIQNKPVSTNVQSYSHEYDKDFTGTVEIYSNNINRKIALHRCFSRNSSSEIEYIKTNNAHIYKGIYGITNIAFAYSTALTSISIDSAAELNYVNANSFLNCTALTGFNVSRISNNKAALNGSAFVGCSNLVFSGESIGSRYKIQSNYVYDDKEKSVTIGAKNTASVTIDESLYSIEKNAYKNNTRLTSIIFPSKLTSIDNEAFAGCSKLKIIKFTCNRIVDMPNNVASNAFNLTLDNVSDAKIQVRDKLATRFTALSFIKTLISKGYSIESQNRGDEPPIDEKDKGTSNYKQHKLKADDTINKIVSQYYTSRNKLTAAKLKQLNPDLQGIGNDTLINGYTVNGRTYVAGDSKSTITVPA